MMIRMQRLLSQLGYIGIIVALACLLTACQATSHRVVHITPSPTLPPEAPTTLYSFPHNAFSGFDLTDMLALGPDHSLWFREQIYPSNQISLSYTKLGRLASDGTVTSYAIPPCYNKNITVSSQIWSVPSCQDIAALAFGEDGNLWFITQSPNTVGKITPSGTVLTFDLPPDRMPTAIVAGAGGYIWVYEQIRSNDNENAANAIVRVSLMGAMVTFPLPYVHDGLNTSQDMTLGPDGNLWFIAGSQNNIDQVGRISFTGQLSFFPTAEANAFFVLDSGFSQIIKGPDQALWLVNPNADNPQQQIVRMTLDGHYTRLTLPKGIDVWSIAFGSDGALWFTNSYQGTFIGRRTPNGTLTFFRGPLGWELDALTPDMQGGMWFHLSAVYRDILTDQLGHFSIS